MWTRRNISIFYAPRRLNLKHILVFAGANPLCSLVMVDGMNHVLKDAPKNRLRNMLTYSKPGLPFSASFVEELRLILGEAVSR